VRVVVIWNESASSVKTAAVTVTLPATRRWPDLASMPAYPAVYLLDRPDFTTGYFSGGFLFGFLTVLFECDDDDDDDDDDNNTTICKVP